MVSTRSKCNASGNDNMTEISDSVKSYLDGLFQAQAETFKKENTRLRATIESRNKQLAELQSITTDLNAKVEKLQLTIDIRDARIKKLEEGLAAAVQRNIQLQSDIATAHVNLETRIDDLEQHGRKMCLRSEGIEIEPNETNAALTKKVEASLNSFGANVTSADFVRLHRSSRPRTTKDGRRVAQTIVRFRNWASRSSAYETRFIGTWQQYGGL